jgi:hypothetical protein
MEDPSITQDQVKSLAVVHQLLPWRQQLSGGFGTQHGNADLAMIDVLIVMLAAFYNPLVRTQRLVEALSSQEWMQKQSGTGRMARSTLSDALKRFDSEALRPLIRQLVEKIPSLRQRDGDLLQLTRQIVAADGSFFNLAGEVAWALHQRRGSTSKSQSRVRLNLQLDIATFVPLDMDLSGCANASEPKALLRRLRPDVIYVADRAFGSFELLTGILAAGSSFVIRMKKDLGFAVMAERELTPRDRELDIRADATGVLPGPKSPGNANARSCTGRPPGQVLRRVVVWDRKNKKEVALLTDMLEVPALVIAEIYRRRWVIELFFKWLKCWAGFDHAISQSPQGLTFQFYVAVIGTLLLYLATGRPVNKYGSSGSSVLIRTHVAFKKEGHGFL